MSERERERERGCVRACMCVRARVFVHANVTFDQVWLAIDVLYLYL